MPHYSEILEVLRNPAQDIRIRYTELYRILCLVLEEATQHTGIDFSGPFARLTFACQNKQIERALHYPINNFRGRCHNLHEHTREELTVLLPHDAACLTELVRQVQVTPVPDELLSMLPSKAEQPERADAVPKVEKMRVSVLSWDDRYILAVPEDGFEEQISIDYVDDNGHLGGWAHLKPLLNVGTQLGLLNCVAREGIFHPEVIILEPDYLVDVSTVAACFKAYGITPYAHLTNRLGSKEASPATLLGNFAGQLLDEEINRQRTSSEEESGYAASARRFMQMNALQILSVKDQFSGFHSKAQNQLANIRKILQQAVRHDKALDMDHVLLEASFMCEALGLQGRMDLITDDCRVLMEQKSGKRDEFRNRHVESHYVQMLLYQAMLHYGFGIRNDDISCYLLYSKYEDGLLKEGAAPQLLKQALQIRNQMVWLDFRLCKGGTQLLEQLVPEHFRGVGCSDRFWNEYVKDPLARLLDAIKDAPAEAKAYYHRMTGFVAQEHLLAKIGAPGREADGMASLWKCSLEEKLLAGNILLGLRIVQTVDCEENGTEQVVLQFSGANDLGIPNFRKGDSVILYAYPDNTVPNACGTILFRCTILAFNLDSVELQLRTPQRNHRIFEQTDCRVWAVEHDCVESGFSALYRSVYSLLTTTEDRRQLLMAQRQPEADSKVALSLDFSMDGKCPHFNQLVLRARQAKDYFMLVGPPGTGKTSFGLVNILLETLAHPEESVLLLSYTNRAVDEICSKLVQHGIDFIRIGRPHACSEAYHPYLLEQRIKPLDRIDEIDGLIRQTRVFVGTTSSISSHAELLQLKVFDMAIIDEASQILEPQIMGIFCATCNGEPSIKKFVMIGDHKQLPAVVLQPSQTSAVSDALLNGMGLMDCRESLFQRLVRLQERTFGTESPYMFTFTRQGRMHPDVAHFAVKSFYEDNLGPVPLPHQLSPLHFPVVDADCPLQQIMATRRTVFFPSSAPVDNLSPKTNVREARMIARTVQSVYRLYRQNRKPFIPHESVGVIVPYRLQIVQVMQEIASLGIPELNGITVDTVERYQGSQRDVIIYGFTVRQPYQLQFLCSQSFVEQGTVIDRKLNVALTRAREQLVLIGNPTILSLDEVHRRLIEEIGATTFPE